MLILDNAHNGWDGCCSCCSLYELLRAWSSSGTQLQLGEEGSPVAWGESAVVYLWTVEWGPGDGRRESGESLCSVC